MSNNSNNNKTNKNQKHRGENRSGITTQIRLYPLKKDQDDKTKETSYARISVIFDESKKGTEDNLIKIEVPFIEKLELEAEQWLANLIYLKSTIFERKDWLDGKHLVKRFQKYQDFLRKRALKDFGECQKRAMLDVYDSRQDAGEGVTDPSPDEVCSNLEKFIAFVDDRAMLHRLGYMYDNDGLKLSKADALDVCLKAFENGVFFYMGKKLYANPRKAYIEHLKYFKNHIVKPFDESVVNYYNAMMEYAMIFKHLQPPYTKSTPSFFEAKWQWRNELSAASIRDAIHDGLPEAYREHIETCYDTDYLEMDDTEFLNALSAYETIDKSKRKNLKMKEANKVETTRKSEEGTREKKRSNGKGRGNPSKRQKRFCAYCKENDTGKYWTHNTEDCSFKKNAYTGKGKKEANVMEEVLAQVKNQARMIEQLEKKLKNLDDDDMSTN